MIFGTRDRIPTLLSLAVALAPSVAWAEPQVQVEVLDEEGEADDFFTPPKEKKPAQESSAEAEERAPGQSQEVEALERDMAEARKRIDEKRAERATTPATTAAAPKETDDDGEEIGHHSDSRDFWSSWHREPGVHDGDVLLSLIGGPSATGAFAGLALEVMLNDHLGLTASGFADPFSRGHIRTDGWRGWDFASAGWARPHALVTGHDIGGAMHMEELGIAMHGRPKKVFDPYVTLGASHLGYVAEAGESQEIGGAVYLRMGAGVRWFWKSAFLGGEIAWYPVELARYEVLEREQGGIDVVEAEAKTWDARRVVFSMRGGIRF